jgi:hypothetical protein
MNETEGKAAMVAATERGKRWSFNEEVILCARLNTWPATRTCAADTAASTPATNGCELAFWFHPKFEARMAHLHKLSSSEHGSTTG